LEAGGNSLVMKRYSVFILLVCYLCQVPIKGNAQEKEDSLTDQVKNTILGNFKNFKIGFYVDGYVNMELGSQHDTSNLVPLFANCPIIDQIRLNVAAFEIYYNAEKVRGKLQLQFGDAPNLLAAPDKQWIKNIRQATVGIRIARNLWTDVGYMFTPVGIESSWPVINTISTATICAYYEPGALLGIKLSYRISDKVDCGFMVGNPYSLAYQQANHITGLLFVNYYPLKNLTLSYNNIFGNQALRGGEIENNLLYNDILVVYNPWQRLTLTGQFDFAFQTNSKMAPDTNKIASMASGFIQAKFNFLKYFSLSGRYEFYTDPDGFLSGPFTYDGKTTGLSINGTSFSLEYKPVKIAYVRMEYKFLQANKGNNIYYSKTSDNLAALIFTTGIRF